MSLYHRWRRERREIRRQNDKDERERRHNAVLSEKERELESHRAKIEISAGVIWECLSEMGVTSEDLEVKMKEIEDRGWAINPPSYYRLCPKCGKKVFDYTANVFEGTCIYCGHVVNMYPGDLAEG